MNYQTSPWAVTIFISFVAFVLWIAYYYARKTKTSKGYYAAGGNIHWAVNGIAFAGDYLSAASFLGICGMIAAFGYDGFLYSIGYLAGWIVALFVVAEPMKRLGKYTFTDALDSKFNSKGIQFAAALSTLVVSVCYLIPQMVGAGVLIEPLLGLPHIWGVAIVGTIVIIIVATAGMASTTYVQFLKGGLLIVFSTARRKASSRPRSMPILPTSSRSRAAFSISSRPGFRRPSSAAAAGPPTTSTVRSQAAKLRSASSSRVSGGSGEKSSRKPSLIRESACSSPSARHGSPGIGTGVPLVASKRRTT